MYPKRLYMVCIEAVVPVAERADETGIGSWLALSMSSRPSTIKDLAPVGSDASLNLSRAETSSRWCGSVGGGARSDVVLIT
ncbi:hypothetical protein TNCV_2720201 [Trichonephila clavipes]|nr:hypothetical protein TNCV_2720201 [Trichonephila clavipes]